jgi:hypothetical protein
MEISLPFASTLGTGDLGGIASVASGTVFGSVSALSNKASINSSTTDLANRQWLVQFTYEIK